jgi:hypothetical protein
VRMPAPIYPAHVETLADSPDSRVGVKTGLTTCWCECLPPFILLMLKHWRIVLIVELV